MPISYVGVDVSKATLDAFTEVDGTPRHRQFVNAESGYKEMLTWIKKWKIDKVHICMEATDSYWENFAAYVSNLGLRVSVVNPSWPLQRFHQAKTKDKKWLFAQMLLNQKSDE